jgi:hypothetical protein
MRVVSRPVPSKDGVNRFAMGTYRENAVVLQTGIKQERQSDLPKGDKGGMLCIVQYNII